MQNRNAYRGYRLSLSSTNFKYLPAVFNMAFQKGQLGKERPLFTWPYPRSTWLVGIGFMLPSVRGSEISPLGFAHSRCIHAKQRLKMKLKYRYRFVLKTVHNVKLRNTINRDHNVCIPIMKIANHKLNL